MQSEDIQSAIDEVTKLRSKEVAQGQKQMRKLTQDTNQAIEKLNTGAKDLEKIEQSYLQEEGIEKVRKKGKIFFQAVKALGELSRECINATEGFNPFEKETAEYDELKNYVNNISLILSRINKNKRQYEAIMGLEFSLKRRAINGPMGKLNSNLRKMRELLNKEFSYVKILEELNQAFIDCQELESAYKTEDGYVKTQKEELKVIKQQLEELNQQIEILEKEPEIIHYRQLKREIKDLEYKVGKRINFLRKPFRKLVNIAERGEIQVPFDLVGLARKYETDAVITFLENEEKGYPGLQALIDTLLRFGKTNQLRLKKSRLNKLEQDTKTIKDGKLDEWKSKRLSKIEELKELEKMDETKSIREKLENLNNQSETLTNKINEIEETIKIEERNLEEIYRQIKQKGERSESFLGQAR